MTRTARRLRLVAFTLFGVAALGLAGVGFAQHGQRRAAQDLLRLDADGDRAISRAELEAGASARFGAIDADRDGAITLEEIRAHRERLRAERQQRRLARLDRDGDGRITQDEFVAHRLERMERWDRNDDGQLDARDRHRPRG